jgi:hypothetical protein
VSTAILFSPEKVRRVLASLPSLAALILDPAIEGVESEAFPGVLRKTRRELYRWIANTHYEHLGEVVRQLERVLAAGCRFDRLLATRDREQFVSDTAEVFVAEDLLDRGYTVSAIPRSGRASPDLYVVADGTDVGIEVYSPRELVAVDEWVREVSDLLSYADVRASYSSSVKTELERSIPPDRDQPDSWATAEMLDRTREVVLAEITRDVVRSLAKLQPLSKAYRHPATPLLTTVELDGVWPASAAGPQRFGALSYPGFGGYSPAGVLRTIVERAHKKARKRQAEGVSAAARALVVYLMGTKIAEDLAHPAHVEQAEAELAELDPQRYGLDVITFVVRALPRGLAAVFTVADDATLTIPQVEAMFGRPT